MLVGWISCLAFMFELLFLFFEQKTAYDMRISDWSSDVCSSDLLPRIRLAGPGLGAQHADVRPPRRGTAPRPGAQLSASSSRATSACDRKSVVSGKIVSVCVDLGCRRIIKKTSLNTYTLHYHYKHVLSD